MGWMDDEREPVGGAGRLSRPPAPARVAPPVDLRQKLLPFHDPAFDWATFQRLCAAVAQAEGYTDVVEYGRPGQKQYGLDIYATGVGRKACVYQARWLADVRERDLCDAVEEYVSEGQRLAAGRFVLCVTCSALDTAITDRREQLRAAYAPLEIEIYGSERLSDILRDQPNTVRVFFGDAWARAFCSTPEPTSRLDPEALLRGPISALELTDMVEAAAVQEETNPADAAIAYDRIADRLAGNYPMQARTFREKAAQALARAGRHQEGFERWFDLAMRDLWDAAQPRPSIGTREGFKVAGGQLGPAQQARVRVVEAWHSWHEHPAQRAELATAFDDLDQAADRTAPRAAVFFAEAHVVDRDVEPIRARWQALSRLCATLDTPESVRLRAALADVDGADAWEALFAMAVRRELPLRHAAYIAGRAGRWYAWNGKFDQAETAYRRAVELGAEAQLEADVRNALFSLTTIYSKDRRLFERMRTANVMSLSVEGQRSYVPQHPRTRENALRALTEDRSGPDAHMWLRHQLWEAFASADLGLELETLRDLGALYSTSGFGSQALDAFLRAGDDDKARDLIRTSGTWVDVTPYAQHGPPWQRQAALAAIAVEGDRVPDQTASSLVPMLATLLTDDDLDLAVAAARAAGAIALQLPLADATRLADAFAPHAPREPRHYRQTDPGLLEFVARAYNAHPQLRGRLAGFIAEVAHGELIPHELRSAVMNCRDDPKPVADLLVQQAEHGSATAQVLLDSLGVEHVGSVERGRQRLAEVMELGPASVRSEHKFGAGFRVPLAVLRDAGPIATAAFATKLVSIGLDRNEMVFNRVAALEALMEAASLLTAEDRSLHFKAVLPLVRATGLSDIEAWQQQANHPLSRFRLDLGGIHEVQSIALSTAVTLADVTEDLDAVLDTAFDLLRQPHDADALAYTFAALHKKGLSIDAPMIAFSPEGPLRQAAMDIWSETAIPRELGTRFVEDPAPQVRVALARRLDAIAQADAALAKELRDKLLRDASAHVRFVAARQALGAPPRSAPAAASPSVAQL